MDYMRPCLKYVCQDILSFPVFLCCTFSHSDYSTSYSGGILLLLLWLELRQDVTIQYSSSGTFYVAQAGFEFYGWFSGLSFPEAEITRVSQHA